MRIYIFKSDAKSELRAFAWDVAGSKLPDRFRPWHVVGVVGPDRDPPHHLPREEIERAISARGFQLWRVKPKTQVARIRPANRSKPARSHLP
jgi:hypothetical protein